MSCPLAVAKGGMKFSNPKSSAVKTGMDNINEHYQPYSTNYEDINFFLSTMMINVIFFYNEEYKTIKTFSLRSVFLISEKQSNP